MANQSFLPIQFCCRHRAGKRLQHWYGAITRFIDYGSHYEINVDSRSGFTFFVGKCMSGSFISIPAFNAGSSLAGYDDYCWNNERLATIMNPVDAATVAEALRTLKTKNLI